MQKQAQMELGRQIAAAITNAVEAVQPLVTQALQEQREALVEAARAIWAEGGPQKHNRLSVLRSQMRRASRALGYERSLTIKRASGDFAVLEATRQDPTVRQSRKLAASLELVTQNLDKALVRRRLLEALKSWGAHATPKQREPLRQLAAVPEARAA